jgi:sigma-B regulation protein RsbU (phosphoserine phosphatase)
MYSEFLEQLRTSLKDKRDSLTGWLETSSPDEKQLHLGDASEADVKAHLDVIEDNLEKVSTEEFGICEICHESVDPEILQMDYTATVCLGHFTEEQISSLELELELASGVQKSLLPQQIPDSPYLDISAFSRPAQVIGGDYFDFFKFGDGSEGLAIADVAGHGVSAALHMSSIQALLRTLVPTSSSPLEIIQHIQRLLIHNLNFSNFVTVFLASFDPSSNQLKYCNAGHNPPLLVSRNGRDGDSSSWLYPTGAAVGLIENLLIKEAAVKASPGDVLVLYTDGVTEAMNAAGEQFGYDRLAEVARRMSKSPSKEIVQAIRQELFSFTQQETFADDTTILACRILG